MKAHIFFHHISFGILQPKYVLFKADIGEKLKKKQNKNKKQKTWLIMATITQ